VTPPPNPTASPTATSSDPSVETVPQALGLSRTEQRAFEADAAEYVRVQTRRYPPTTLAKQMGQADILLAEHEHAHERRQVPIDTASVQRARRMLDWQETSLPLSGLVCLVAIFVPLGVLMRTLDVHVARMSAIVPFVAMAAFIGVHVWFAVHEKQWRRTLSAAEEAARARVVSLPWGATEATADHEEALRKIRMTSLDPALLVAAARTEQDMAAAVRQAPVMGRLWRDDDTFDTEAYQSYWQAMGPCVEDIYRRAGEAVALAALAERRA
jgi:hypothetical protein